MTVGAHASAETREVSEADALEYGVLWGRLDEARDALQLLLDHGSFGRHGPTFLLLLDEYKLREQDMLRLLGRL